MKVTPVMLFLLLLSICNCYASDTLQEVSCGDRVIEAGIRGRMSRFVSYLTSFKSLEHVDIYYSEDRIPKKDRTFWFDSPEVWNHRYRLNSTNKVTAYLSNFIEEIVKEEKSHITVKNDGSIVRLGLPLKPHYRDHIQIRGTVVEDLSDVSFLVTLYVYIDRVYLTFTSTTLDLSDHPFFRTETFHSNIEVYKDLNTFIESLQI